MQLDHIGINVRDLDQTLAFYCDWFGFEVFQRWEQPRQAFLSKNDLILGVMENPDYDFSRYTLAHLAFAVSHDEFQAWVSKIELAGLSIVSGPKPQRDGETILFSDPSGNILEVCYPALHKESI